MNQSPNNPTYDNFGKTIREARERLPLDVRKAALKMNMNPGYLSVLEHNAHNIIPDDYVIKKLSKLLRLDFHKLKALANPVKPSPPRQV